MLDKKLERKLLPESQKNTGLSVLNDSYVLDSVFLVEFFTSSIQYATLWSQND